MRGLAVFVGGIAVSVILALLILHHSPVQVEAGPPSSLNQTTPEVPAASEETRPPRRLPRFVEHDPGPPHGRPVVMPSRPDSAPVFPSGMEAKMEKPTADHTVVRTGSLSAPIVAFDPRLWNALRRDKNRLGYLSYAGPVRACARAFMQRHQYRTWTFGGLAQVRTQVSAGVVRFESVEITNFDITGNSDRSPDREFIDCYQRSVNAMTIRCPECKDGALEFPWKLRTWDYLEEEGLHAEPDPATDERFSIERNSNL
jgi:hypothetical protein